MTTVIATDGIRAGQAGARRRARRWRRPPAIRVVLVTAWQIPVGDFGLPYASIATTDLIDAERKVAETTLSEAADRAKEIGVTVETDLREGDAAGSICDVAAERDARMIVHRLARLGRAQERALRQRGRRRPAPCTLPGADGARSHPRSRATTPGSSSSEAISASGTCSRRSPRRSGSATPRASRTPAPRRCRAAARRRRAPSACGSPPVSRTASANGSGPGLGPPTCSACTTNEKCAASASRSNGKLPFVIAPTSGPSSISRLDGGLDIVVEDDDVGARLQQLVGHPVSKRAVVAAELDQARCAARCGAAPPACPRAAARSAAAARAAPRRVSRPASSGSRSSSEAMAAAIAPSIIGEKSHSVPSRSNDTTPITASAAAPPPDRPRPRRAR